MCLAIPGRVVKVDEKKGTATVDYEAEQREAGTVLIPDLKVGDYVLVQARMIVLKVPEKEAKAALDEIRNSDRKLVSR
jgi:hydrogenase expression/formation protein HypC